MVEAISGVVRYSQKSCDHYDERSESVFFADQFREAREKALCDTVAFDGIIHTIERLGTHLCGMINILVDINLALRNWFAIQH